MANEDILKVIEETIQQYRPGGEFAVSRGQQLAEKRGTVIPEMYSGLISAGLGGTTIKQTVPTRFESEIAKPFQTETDLLRSQRLMEALLAKAGFMERAEQRTQEYNLAQEKMKLDEQLANKQITAQEYAAYNATLGGGGDTSPLWSETTTPFGEFPKEQPTGDAGGTGADYGGMGVGYSNEQIGYQGGTIAGMTKEQSRQRALEQYQRKLKNPSFQTSQGIWIGAPPLDTTRLAATAAQKWMGEGF